MYPLIQANQMGTRHVFKTVLLIPCGPLAFMMSRYQSVLSNGHWCTFFFHTLLWNRIQGVVNDSKPFGYKVRLGGTKEHSFSAFIVGKELLLKSKTNPSTATGAQN